MSASERRAEIIKISEGRRQENIKNLAFQLGVSARTIRYDILALTREYPIETVRGNGGCVRLAKNYRMYKNDMTQEQQELLFSLMNMVDESKATILCELLCVHGSIRYKDKIEAMRMRS